MQNEKSWKPSKFVWRGGRIRANKEFKELHPKSWVVAECTAAAYNSSAPRFLRGNILDLGCGLCPLYPLYQRYVSSIFCIDWANSLHANPYTDLECDIMEPIPLENNSFDTVILSDVLEHIPKPEKLLNEIHRLLKKDGYLILNVPVVIRSNGTEHES